MNRRRVRSVGGVELPPVTDGLNLFLIADAGVTDNPASGWDDNSGKGHNAAQSTADLRPDVTSDDPIFSTGDSLTFDGADSNTERMVIAHHADLRAHTDGMTWFVLVSQDTNDQGDQNFISKGNPLSAGGEYALFATKPAIGGRSSMRVRKSDDSGNTTLFGPAVNLQDGNAHLIMFRHNAQSSDGKLNIAVDGGTISSSAAVAPLTSASNSVVIANLTDFDGTKSLDGNLKALLMYQRELSGAEADEVEAWSETYGVTIS